MVQFLTPTTPIPPGSFCLRIVVPDDTPWRAALFGALSLLTEESSWVQDGLLDPADTVQALQLPVLEAIEGGDWCMIGAVWPYASADPPPHTLKCDGTIYLRADYPKLADVLDAAFIIDADHFAVPNLIERFVLGAGLGIHPYGVGDTGGEVDHTLIIAEMPAHFHVDGGHAHTDAGHTHTDSGHAHTDAGHTHTDSGHAHGIPATTDGLAVAPGELPVVVPIPLLSAATSSATANIQTGSADIQNGNADLENGAAAIQDGHAVIGYEGGDGPHNNMPPFLALNYCIVYE